MCMNRLQQQKYINERTSSKKNFEIIFKIFHRFKLSTDFQIYPYLEAMIDLMEYI
jgi:hypothetical protein